ncbi:MAG: (2Fe-2S) ferredoxin domain-containing protein [Chloroflexi bacterium]|nr:(2Fe-2S) ferredoxin domain-containing protein [Chloroflexota bacterium]
MPKVKSLEDLNKLRQQAQQDLKVREKAGTQIIIGMGTCGIAAGARETLHAILDELARRELAANVTTVGCIGMCTEEPLVDIVQPGQDRITYGHLTADRVARLVEEHLVNGRVVREWVVGQIAPSGN